jgi:hypothetical protein
VSQSNTVVLRQHGSICAEFILDSGPLDKSIRLYMRQTGKPATILVEMTMLGDKLVYSSAGNQPVIKQGEEQIEHAPEKSS